MKKKFFIIFFTLIFILVSGIIYLNLVFPPTKIQFLITQRLQEATHKKVSLESVRFNIFKGLVLRNLVIYDDKETFLHLKEGSCNFLILPLFFKKVIIPTVKLRSLTVFLERRPDNKLNILDLFAPSKTIETLTQNKKFSILVYKIAIINSSINFKDETLSPAFSKTADNLNLVLHLSLPIGIKFDFNSEIQGTLKAKVVAAGEYKISQKELEAKVSIKDLPCQDFFSYYKNFGVIFTKGAIDAFLNIKFKEDTFFADSEAEIADLILSKNEVEAQLNSNIKAHVQYNLKNNQLKFSGSSDITQSNISGLEFFDKVNDIKARLSFDNSGLFTDKLTANFSGIPFEAKLRLTDFQNPFLSIDITSGMVNLGYIKNILKDRFKFILPADLQGAGGFSLKIESKIPFAEPLPINGHLEIFNAILKPEKLKSPFENISGRLEFSSDRLKWPELNFRYLGISYKTEGSLTNFKAPEVQLRLSSNDLYLESEFGVKDRLIRFCKLDGRYLNSDFSIKGDIDLTDLSSLETDIIAAIVIDTNDLKELLKKLKDKLEGIKPSGIVHAKINLNGNINDIKSCLIQADLSSSSLSIYGLKSESLSINYYQENGLADIPLIHFSFYDGAIEAAARMNLSSENLPYWVSANIKDINLAKLKLDTTAKGKDIKGTLTGEVKINGFYTDLSRVTGTGKISISGGKIWELNLFQGLGKLLFAKDFASIIFNEGYCDFFIQDKSIFTNNLKMKSEFVDLTGPMKIGFDSSIDASLNVHVDDEMVPMTGTFKDVTTAIIGQAGRFGIIKISGTLREPKYKFQTVALDILKALKETFFGK